ncbi:FHA domain-containing protein [Yoonia algicola]|uniref:FHA domain-containing protein n=1 Tax=Yoonia algicola TaxID=3137368 RepID=A0AAN0M3F7_9RHOB
MIALAATVLLLAAIAGTVVYYLRPQTKAAAVRSNADGGKPGVLPRAKPVTSPFLIAKIGDNTFPLTTQMMQKGLVIGRGDDADLRVDDQLLSRAHVKIILRDRKLQMQDLGSTNGTRLDGVQLEARKAVQINTKSQIDLGGLSFTLTKTS